MVLNIKVILNLFGGKLKFKKDVDDYLIRNEDHGMYSKKPNKQALNSFDDKRKQLCNIESIPWTEMKFYSSFEINIPYTFR